MGHIALVAFSRLSQGSQHARRISLSHCCNVRCAQGAAVMDTDGTLQNTGGATRPALDAGIAQIGCDRSTLCPALHKIGVGRDDLLGLALSLIIASGLDQCSEM